MDLAHRRPTSDFTFYFFLAEACIASATYDICVYRFFFFVLPWGILPLKSAWNLSCDHGLEIFDFM